MSQTGKWTLHGSPRAVKSGEMERFKRNIDRILLSGGTPSDKERWTEYYHVYQSAIDATKDAYMPNAQRKKEYLRIYEDVAETE